MSLNKFTDVQKGIDIKLAGGFEDLKVSGTVDLLGNVISSATTTAKSYGAVTSFQHVTPTFCLLGQTTINSSRCFLCIWNYPSSALTYTEFL